MDNPNTADISNRTLLVNEIYRSIQGESTWAGLPCVFVRLARCNLRCTWCDTAYAFHGGEKQTLARIMEQVAAHDTPLVEITGGEPLAQADCPALAELLLAEGYTVLVETSGSLPIDTLPDGAIRIMDLKCPGSGEVECNHWPNLDFLDSERDEVKFVLAGREDYEWSRDVVRRYTLEKRCRAVLFSTVFGQLEVRQLVSWVLEDHLPVRVQIQLHKLIWSPDQRRV